MYVYKITNDINQKIYIGQTIRPIEQRFKRHINDSIHHILDTHFARAIRKYGSEHFRIELIDVAENQEELNLKEQYWIRYYDSINNGYNETDALNKCGGNTYQSKNDTDMEKISQKIRQTKIGNKNPNARAVKCYNTLTHEELYFDTINECRKYFDEPYHRFITNRVNHQTQSLYQGIWNIAYSNEEYPNVSAKKNKTGTQLIVTDIRTKKVYQFSSVRQASRELNIQRNLINSYLKDNNVFEINNYKFSVIN